MMVALVSKFDFIVLRGAMRGGLPNSHTRGNQMGNITKIKKIKKTTTKQAEPRSPPQVKKQRQAKARLRSIYQTKRRRQVLVVQVLNDTCVI